MEKTTIANVDLTNPTLTLEEMYYLTQFYVRYYWAINKFYSLKDIYEEEDVTQEIYLKFLRHNLAEKYDQSITSKKYYIMRGVFTSMVDLLRKQKAGGKTVISLDTSYTDEGTDLVETIVDEKEHGEENVIGKDSRDYIMSQLPTTPISKIYGFSPLYNREISMNYRDLAAHLEADYTVKDLAKIYRNPRTGECLSEGTVNRYVNRLRDYVRQNVAVV